MHKVLTLNHIGMQNGKLSHRDQLKGQIAALTDAIQIIKRTNEIEFRKDFDFGFVVADTHLVKILKEGVISFFDEQRIRARAELDRLNSK